MTALKILGGAVAVVALGGVAAVFVGSVLWHRATARLEADLLDGIRQPYAPTEAPYGDVPEPVARFLSRALPSDGRRIASALIAEEGTFQMGQGAKGWRPFRANHSFRAHPPGFVWDARIKMAPFVVVRVRDFYLNGEASMLGKVGSVATVVNESGRPELAAGALYRFLAEAAWIPSRLVPGDGLTWEAENDTTAYVTLEDAGNRVSLRVRFTPDGDIREIFTAARPKQVDGRYEEAPWVGRFWAHEDIDGFRVPREGEVAWIGDEGEVPYWRGRLTEVTLNVVGR